MSPSKRKLIVGMGVLCVAILIVGLVSLVPDVVSQLSYAAERGKAEAAREQLSRAAGLTESFQNVADALRPAQWPFVTPHVKKQVQTWKGNNQS